MQEYYHRKPNKCSHCGRQDADVQIGAYSAGHLFLFKGSDFIRSWEDWQKELEQGEIVDEAGNVISLAHFVMIVESTKGKDAFPYTCQTWICDNGNGYQFIQ